MFSTVLIANRGEVAVRIIRACRECDVRTVVVYSDADAYAIPVQLADQAVRIGPPPPAESYLHGERIIEAALHTGAQAVHPGFGFLSENAVFAEAVGAAGLTFIGPDPDAIRLMGIKTAALDLMRHADVPTVPGYDGGGPDSAFADAAARIGYPVLVKAAAGGGGKGMRVVQHAEDLLPALESARRESARAFGDGRVFLEKYIAGGRHVEIQILADRHGHTVHLGERDCSIQRRHQKIIEESPSPYLTADLRDRMGSAAVRAAQAVNYVNAGTVEFIVDDRSGAFFFLEMNTRLQVEHPVTEMVTGVDLVKLQLHIAAGEALPFTQAEVMQRGHAIECRVYAEDPANAFLPSIGRLLHVVEPQAPGVRVDSGVRGGDAITVHYDPMIAKLIVHGQDRADALRKMDVALGQYVIMGVATNLLFLRDVIRHPVFVAGTATTAFIDQHMAAWKPAPSAPPDEAVIAAALAELLKRQPATSADGQTAVVHDPWARADGFRIGK